MNVVVWNVFLGGVLLGSTVSGQAQGAPPGSPPTVRVTAPKPVTAATRYTVPGRTEPFAQVRVFTRATGTVRERRFDIGARVAAGEVLAIVDAPDVDRAVAAAAATVEQAEAQAKVAEVVARRAAALAEQQVGSAEDAEVRAAEAAAAAAAVRRARAEHARLLEVQGFAVVRAPFAGIVAARNVERGDRVRGDASGAEDWLYELVAVEQLRFVTAAAPELALRVDATPQATVTFREYPGRDFPVVRALRSGVFAAAEGSMRIELLLDNPGMEMSPGMTGSATFVLPVAGSAFLVPSNALQLREGRSSVAIVEAGRIRRLEVVVGRTRGNEVEVAHAGLQPGSQVILNPNALLADGAEVRAIPATETSSR